MALTVGYDASGLDGKLRNVLDSIVAAIQTWAGKVDGVNAAERFNELSTGIASLPTVKPGMTVMWPTATIPDGYLKCDGAAVSRTAYANLFAVIGISEGAGDGINTFNVPDMRGYFPFGLAVSGTGSTLLGTFGSIDHAHTMTHDHGAGTLTTATPEPSVNVAAGAGASANDPLTTDAITGQTGASSAANTGTANPPGKAWNFIIKT